MAKINRRLHLVVPIERERGTFYAHATPIPTEEFQQFFLVMGKAFASIYSQGLGALAGPRVAAMLLKKAAEETNQLEDVEQALLQDIRRLTNVLCPTATGWETLSFTDAVNNGILDAEDVSEVENAVVFFTLAWHMHKRAEREEIIASAAAIWSAQATYSDCTAFSASLPTSTTGAGSTSKTG